MGLRDWFHRLWGYVEPDPVVDACITDDGFRFTMHDGSVQLVAWPDLERIDLHMVQGGGSGDRMHYIFQTADLEVRVARTAPGFKAIEDRLPRLPGFDGWTYATAQRHFQDLRIPIWERGKIPDSRGWWVHILADLRTR